MQKVLISILVLGISFGLSAQNNTNNRKGVTFGLGVGIGTLSQFKKDTTRVNFTTTLPNLRIGYMINNKLAIQLLLPGSPYKLDKITRSFEGVLLSGQYWVKEKWWLMGGVGVALDSPAFWTVKDFNTATFYAGFPAVTFATGYQLYRKKNFEIDLQYRIYAGQVSLSDNIHKTGVSNMFCISINWY